MPSASMETTSEPISAIVGRPLFVALAILAGVSIVAPLSIAGWSLLAPANDGNRIADRQSHRELCRSLRNELYTKDRWRAVRGFVTDPEGQPIAGARVQSIDLEAIIELARHGTPMQPWGGLVEAETRAVEGGHYEFPHLPVGARTFCYSAEDRSPVVQELIAVQDGVGARLDVTLGAAKELRIWIPDPPAEPGHIFVIPHRWWPTLMITDVTADIDWVTVAGLGGPFDKGLIAFRSAGANEWRLVGRFDLAESDEAVADLNEFAAAYAVPLPEVDCIAPWSEPPTASHRLFYSAISPTALRWDGAERVSSQSSRHSPSAVRFIHKAGALADGTGTAPATGAGTVRGFGSNPFLPVLVESESGDAWFGVTSDASEFAFSGLPDGYFRIRTWRHFAQQTFSRGVFARRGAAAEVRTSIYEHVDFDEPRSREVVGANSPTHPVHELTWCDMMPASIASSGLSIATKSGDLRFRTSRTACTDFGRLRKRSAGCLSPNLSRLVMLIRRL